MRKRLLPLFLLSFGVTALAMSGCSDDDEGPADPNPADTADSGTDDSTDAGDDTSDAGDDPSDAGDDASADSGDESDAGEDASADSGDDDDAGDSGPSDPQDGYDDVCRDSVVASPKGTYLAYKTCAGTEGVYLQKVADGTRTLLTETRGDRMFFSPDEEQLFISGGGQVGLAVVNTSGTPNLETLQDQNVTWALVTPDGSKVVWSANRKQLFSQNVDGSGTATKLLEWGGGDPMLSLYPPVVTPDGKYVIVSDSDSAYGFNYVVPVDGSEEAKKLDDRKLLLHPSSLTNTHVLASAVLSGVVTFEEFDIVNRTSAVIAGPQSERVVGDSVFWAVNGSQIHTWKRGDAAGRKLTDEGGQRFATFANAGGIFWFGTEWIRARSVTEGSTPIDVLRHGDVIGDFFSISPTNLLLIVTAKDGEHGIQLASLTKAESGVYLDEANVPKVGDSVGFNGTYTHALYFQRAPGSDDNALRSAPLTTRTPETIAEDVWRWGPIPNSSKVFAYTDVDDITDVVSTLLVLDP